MATVSSLGIGSGIDINGLVENIVSAEGEPTTKRLELREAEYQAELSSYGVLKGSLSTFQSALTSIRSSSTFLSLSAKVDDTDALTVSAASNAKEGNYAIEVEQLAQTHSLASTAFTNITDTIGTGTLTFKFGTTSYDPDTDAYTGFTQDSDSTDKEVVITDGSLEGIRDAVNNAGIVDRIMRGFGTVASQASPAGYLGYDASLEPRFDLDKARELVGELADEVFQLRAVDKSSRLLRGPCADLTIS